MKGRGNMLAQRCLQEVRRCQRMEEWRDVGMGEGEKTVFRRERSGDK